MIDAFICDAVRTPIGRYAGALSALRTDDLAALPLAALLTRNPSLAAAGVDEVILGCANQAGEDNRNVARMASLLAGYPVEVPGVTLNRLCGSGLDAVAVASRAIKTGEAELVIAGGVESMSRAPLVMPKAEAAFSREAQIYDTTIGWRFVNPRMKSQYGIDSMPETGENVAAQFGVGREDQDRFALRSQERVAAARARGFFKGELMSVEIAERKGKVRLVSEDEHPRDTTLEQLAKLPTPFRANGTVTAGNAAGINDGACALIVASPTAVARFHLTPRAPASSRRPPPVSSRASWAWGRCPRRAASLSLRVLSSATSR
jgi:acetyl-CoA acyltransferase